MASELAVQSVPGVITGPKTTPRTTRRKVPKARFRRKPGHPEFWVRGHKKPAQAKARAATSCEACGSNSPRHSQGFRADHNHDTGLFRGVLCHPCNTVLGFAEKHGMDLSPTLAVYLARTNDAPSA